MSDGSHVTRHVTRAVVPAPPTKIEGDYTSWTLKLSILLPSDHHFDNISVWIDEDNLLLYVLYDYQLAPFETRFCIYSLTDGSAIYESPALTDYTYASPDSMYHYVIEPILSNVASRSHMSYIAIIRNDHKTLEVWRKGVKLWSRDIQLDNVGALIYGVLLSPSGKYIIAVPSGVTRPLLCYIGS